MGHDINKEFWKNCHFENMRAGFLQRCQNLLRRFTPEIIHFQAWKKMILNNNNVIDFDPIKIQTCLAPHNDRQHLLFVKDIYVDAKKRPQNVLNGHFWNLNFQKKIFQNWKTQFSNQIVIYVVALDQIRIQTCLASQNDCKNLSFVKDDYVVREKMTRNGLKKPNL